MSDADTKAPTTGLFANLSPSARAFHDEYWDWLFNGPERDKPIGEKKRELREKYGEGAYRELLAALRANGFLA